MLPHFIEVVNLLYHLQESSAIASQLSREAEIPWRFTRFLSAKKTIRLLLFYSLVETSDCEYNGACLESLGEKNYALSGMDWIYHIRCGDACT